LNLNCYLYIIIIRYDFSNIIDTSVNLNKNNKMVNQSLFINDIILSILSKQINNDNTNTNTTTNTTTTNLNDLPILIVNNKNEDDLLIIDDFMEQQQEQEHEQQNKFISSELMPS
jgi:hypothetical protein